MKKEIPNEIKTFLEAIGINANNIEVCEMPKSEYFKHPLQGLFEEIIGDKDEENNVSDAAFMDYMLSHGISEEKANDLIKEMEENRRKKEAEVKAVDNSVIVMTMKAIAAAYGYRIEGVYRIDGTPVVKTIEYVGNDKYMPYVYFDAEDGFMIDTKIVGLKSVNEIDKYIKCLTEASNMCRALNTLDWRAWPEIDV